MVMRRCADAKESSVEQAVVDLQTPADWPLAAKRTQTRFMRPG